MEVRKVNGKRASPARVVDGVSNAQCIADNFVDNYEKL